MMTQPLPIVGKMPIKTLVAKQLPTNNYTCICICIAILYQTANIQLTNIIPINISGYTVDLKISV